MEYYKDLKTYLQENKDHVFRIEGKEYLANQKEIQFPPNVVIDYCKITQVIDIPSICSCLIGVNSLWLDIISLEDRIYHTKLGIDSTVRFFHLSDINITDVTKDWKDYCKSKGLEEN